jgi:hypothetical protein
VGKIFEIFLKKFPAPWAGVAAGVHGRARDDIVMPT